MLLIENQLSNQIIGRGIKKMLPKAQEHYSSHIPALALLMHMGWQFLPQAKCMAIRGSNRDLLLRPILIEVLKSRRFEYKGKYHALSAQGIEQILRELVSLSLNEGLLVANEALYHKLALGITVTEFMPDGKSHQATIPIIHWQDVVNNQFHVTEEFEVLSTQGTHTRRPDIVCFINGIPLVVIEAKRPDSNQLDKAMVDEGVSQNIRNQKADEIPALFVYSQLLLAISMSEAKYATTATPAKFWSQWKEQDIGEEEFTRLKNSKLNDGQKALLFSDALQDKRSYFEQLWAKPMLVSGQDRLLISLLKPERLLEFVRYFILFDRKLGKIAARYQQAFGIKALLKKLSAINEKGQREGGVLWHTTGSGKSFTMVYLCKALLLAEALKECRVIVVTDRVDLEKQLSKTFMTGGALGGDFAGKKSGDDVAKVKTGKQLAQRISKGNERIMFTIINKFNSATKLAECYNPSENIIVLVDEGHRSQGGETHERMRKALPNAAFVAFTGTPLLKDDKTTNKFGAIIHAYTMKTAVADGTVTPLLYEERVPELDVNQQSIDRWFEKITAGLSDQQKNDLKKKFANKGSVYGASRRIELIAWDISVHFYENFKLLDKGLKGQLACDSKLSAIRYKKFLDDIGKVSSRVVISSVDTREGHESVEESSLPEVQQWWKDNIKEDLKTYEDKVLDDFSTEGDPDLLIVVDKLLTGFDEPRNTVLYIDKALKEHNLIQAIARVNRLHEAKRFGYLIDYRGILKELDTAIIDYQDLESRTQQGFDIEDIDGLYQNIDTEYKRLPSLHKALLAIFKDVENRSDIEQYRRLFVPKFKKDEEGDEYDVHQKTREDFYEALTDFGLCLKIALSSRGFFEAPDFSEKTVSQYKRDLAWFSNLKNMVRQDAQETIEFSVYEKQIKNLVDKEVQAVGIRETDKIWVVSELGADDPSKWDETKIRNQTDIIRTRIKKTIEQELNEDPYARKVFSELLKEAIREAEAMFEHPLKQYALFEDFEEKLKQGEIEDTPQELKNNRHARAYYGVFRLLVDESVLNHSEQERRKFVDEAFEIDEIVKRAVAENSLNPLGIEAQIRKVLLPRLFDLLGLDLAKMVIEQVIAIMRAGVAKQ